MTDQRQESKSQVSDSIGIIQLTILRLKIMSKNIQIMLRPEASRSYQTLLGAEVMLARPMSTNCL